MVALSRVLEQLATLSDSKMDSADVDESEAAMMGDLILLMTRREDATKAV
jgi:hypothetical protein